MSRLGPARREAGFRRVGAATKWLAAGAALLTGFFMAITARSTGHATATPATAPGNTPAAPGTATVGPDAVPADPGLQVPDQIPLPTRQAPIASSGGT